MKVIKSLQIIIMRFALFALACLFSLSNLWGQETVVASGGDGSGSGGYISFSVGQTAYYYNIGTTGYENQGVQQPHEIFVTGIHENHPVLSFSVYPNPTSDYLTLTLDESKTHLSKSMKYELYDPLGKQIKNDDIVDLITTIDLKELVPATYFLRVLNNNKEIQIIKVVKN